MLKWRESKVKDNNVENSRSLHYFLSYYTLSIFITYYYLFLNECGKKKCANTNRIEGSISFNQFVILTA